VPSHRFDRIFTAAEANELIPRLEILIRQAQTLAGEFRQQISELVKLDPGARQLELPQIIRRHPELREPATRMAQVAQKIESHGCVLKDIDQGLVDFPCELEEGQVVFLCWQFGEPVVIAWHAVDAGYAQRQALPGTRKPYLN
jgi:hypothetical protein